MNKVMIEILQGSVLYKNRVGWANYSVYILQLQSFYSVLWVLCAKNCERL